jgi:hypothetical protein
MAGGVALLFWFYRDLPVCRNRLEGLRDRNPHTRIFGLYGGDPDDAERFRAELSPLLDDFWAFDVVAPSKWKWRHGDLMLAAWYENRGRDLDWDHVFVVQWDMLVLEPAATLLPALAPDEVLLSGVVPVAAHTGRWVWAEGGHEPAYRGFLEMIQKEYGAVEPLSCLFVIACLPRRLLAAYAELPDAEVGYIEYRLPTLASAVGLRLVNDERVDASQGPGANARSAGRRQSLLNGTKRAIHLPTILFEMNRRDGARLFHPYFGLFPSSPAWALKATPWAVYVGARHARQAVMARVKRFT